MVFLKVIKNKAYFKRFQVKYRRRREGKTDYQARKTLVAQYKDKYAAPKYRLVVRVTNKDIICQIVRSKIVGDEVLTAAYSHELTRYGIPLGHTNYAAAYATGLLLARRHLQKLKLDQKFVGSVKADGSYKVVEEVDGRRPFKAYLDVGLARTTTGAKVFGAMKGVSDGGIFVPHSQNRFPGYNKETKKYDAAKHRQYIFGQHVANYMKLLQETDSEAYSQRFSRFVKAEIKPESLEKMYADAHVAIRKDPAAQKKERAPVTKHTRKAFRLSKQTLKTKKANLAKKKAALGLE